MATAPRVVCGNPTPTTPSYRFGAGRFHDPSGSAELLALPGGVVVVDGALVVVDPRRCLLAADAGRGDALGELERPTPVTATTTPATTRSPRIPSATSKRFDID
jgi:hypothetical protein